MPDPRDRVRCNVDGEQFARNRAPLRKILYQHGLAGTDRGGGTGRTGGTRGGGGSGNASGAASVYAAAFSSVHKLICCGAVASERRNTSDAAAPLGGE